MIRTVIHFSDSDQFGGTERELLHLLAGLDRARWRPVLYHRAEPGVAPLIDEARQLGVVLRPTPQLRGAAGAAKLPGMVRAIRQDRAAVFHAHLSWPLACRLGIVAAALARVPAVVATAQLFVDLPPSRWTAVQHRVLTACMGRYIAVSRQVASQLHDRFLVPASKVSIVPNAIALEPFADRRARPARTGPPTVLTVARLDRQKGLIYLVAAAAEVPEVQFMIVGDGPERAALEAEASARGVADRVQFLGYRTDIPALLADCDLFVLPSLFEGLPLSILEAMAARKAVVASDIGGNDEAVVHGETGLLVPPAEPIALAAGIRTLLADASLRERFGSAGRARVEREFSADVMVRRVAAVYDELLVAHA